MQSLNTKFALAYAKQGWHVFPVHSPLFGHRLGYTCTCEFWRHSDDCRITNPRYFLAKDRHCPQPGKCPRVAWGKASTTESAKILEWWGRNPDANIGVSCGPSDLLVLDFDTYKKSYGGKDLFTKSDHDTVRQRSGGGGVHLFYQRAGQPWGNSSTGLPAGIDIRGAGGYVVLTPSVHKSGAMYSWEIGNSPFEHALAATPTWLKDILNRANVLNLPAPSVLNPVARERSLAQVDAILHTLHADVYPWIPYGDGQKAIFKSCPFMRYSIDGTHEDDASAFVVVTGSGHIAAGCHHARCQKVISIFGEHQGWAFLQDMAGSGLRW